MILVCQPSRLCNLMLSTRATNVLVCQDAVLGAMARAHAEKRAQREQAGSRDEKKTKAIPSSSASRKLMPVDQAMRQTCQGHITSRMKSLRTNMEEAPAHCIMQKREVENPQCSSRWRPLSQLSPLLPRESETQASGLHMRAGKIYTSCLYHTLRIRPLCFQYK